MYQTCENGEKPNFGFNFGPNFFSQVLTLLDVRHCRKLSSYSISRKMCHPNSRKWQKKPHFGPDLGSMVPNSGHQMFFIKPVVRHCFKLSSYTIYRKTSEPNLRKWWRN